MVALTGNGARAAAVPAVGGTVVADVVGRAADMEDPAAIVAAIQGTSMKTIVGTVDWSKGPVKNVSKTRCG